MDNLNKEYPQLVLTTVGKMLDALEEQWRPHLTESSPNDQANFMMHAVGSMAATIANNIAIATNGTTPMREVMNQLFASIQYILDNHGDDTELSTH